MKRCKTMDCTKVNIKKGSKGKAVKELQEYLKYLRYYTNEVDGQCGTNTVEAIKKMQKAYDVKADGVFGSVTCKACGINGQDISKSIQTVELSIFEDMIKRFDEFVKENKREPKLIYLDATTKYRYVSTATYKDMKKRFDEFVKNNTRKPNFIYITLPQTPKQDGKYLAKAKKVLGNFFDAKELYEKIRGKGYGAYNNDVYDFDTALNRLSKGLGINCSDSCQLLYFIFKDMGYDCRFVHIRCKSGGGHIVLDIKYPKGVSSYTRIDPAAALSKSTKAKWGKLWCANGSIIGYNPGWLMTDDGKT